MLFVSLFSWWYGAGWLQLAKRLGTRISAVLEFFSIGLLLKSLFAPFRQISADTSVRGSVQNQLRAWADLQISRVIGAMVRLAVILFGLLAMVIFLIVSLLLIVMWPLVPVLPFIAGIVAFGLSL